MRRLTITACLVASIVTLIVIFGQRRELGALKREESKLRQQTAEAAESTVQTAAAATPLLQHTPSGELLRLRGEVGRLERRKRELAGVRSEHEALRIQLASKGTNAPGGIVLPAGYIRKADAKLAGFSTPEDTMQSMLWAIQNRDATTFLQAFDPETAKRMETEILRRGSAEGFFQEANLMPGLRILSRETEADDTVVLMIEIIPGDATPSQKVRFRQFAGAWRLVSGF